MRSRRISKSTGKTTKTADVTTSKSRATRSKRRQLKNDQLEKELNVVSDRIATSTNSKKQHCKKRKPAPSPSKGKKKPPPSSLQKIKKKQKHVESDNKSDNDDDKKLQVVVADDDDDDETKTKSTAISSTPTTVAVEATAEDAGDKAGYAAVCCAAHVKAPTTTTTTTTKNKKTKGYFDPSNFPQLQHGSFAVAFCPDGSNKLIVDPSFIPGVGCLNCGKQFDSFGNIAHHVTNSYPREMDKADGSKGDLKKKAIYILERVLMRVIQQGSIRQKNGLNGKAKTHQTHLYALSQWKKLELLF